MRVLDTTVLIMHQLFQRESRPHFFLFERLDRYNDPKNAKATVIFDETRERGRISVYSRMS